MFNDLIEELNKLEFECFAYADDLAIVQYDDKNHKALKLALKVIERWTEKNNMSINKNKSGIIFHSNRGKANGNLEFIEGYPV